MIQAVRVVCVVQYIHETYCKKLYKIVLIKSNNFLYNFASKDFHGYNESICHRWRKNCVVFWWNSMCQTNKNLIGPWNKTVAGLSTTHPLRY